MCALGMASTQQGIDELIARHKEALKNIEATKNLFNEKANREQVAGTRLPFAERVRTHFRRHSGAWSTVLYSGCILVLSLRLIKLRRDFSVE